VNALANASVGDYLNKHFVATFQKVGSFRIEGNQKQGGNVATYFCTAKGGILDAVAGPVDANTLLREARWVVENRKNALLESQGDVRRYKQFFRLAHADLLPAQFGPHAIDWQHMPYYLPTDEALVALLEQSPSARTFNQEQRVHLLLAAYPLVKLNIAYKAVYENIVGEKISTRPVAEGRDALPPNPGGLRVAVTPKGWDPLAPGRHSRKGGTTATPDEEKLSEQARNHALIAARNKPSDTSIYAAGPLNVLLEDLERAGDDGAAIRDTPVNADTLAHINLTTIPNGPTAGLLREGSAPPWPAVFTVDPLKSATEETRKSIDLYLPRAIAAIKDHKPDTVLVWKLQDEVISLQQVLHRQVSRLKPDVFVEASRHIQQLKEAVAVLARDDAAKYLNSTFTVAVGKVKTVPELVAYMAENHLTFAPAVAGDETAYLDLHKALVQCDKDIDTSRSLIDAGEL
jgi:hypothetical protein